MILRGAPKIAAPRFSSTSNREDLDRDRVCLDMRIPVFYSILTFSLAHAAAPDESRLEPPARQLSAAALPDRAKGDGVRFVDLNGDGYDDIVVSNDREYGVYLYVPKDKEKKNLQWFEGWTQVLREGKAGDANSLPVIRRESVAFGDGAMWVHEGEKARKIAFAELLKVPGPAPLSPQDSLATMRAKPGFQVELVANEPLVEDPVYVDWDEKGRMWVVEMGDYPFAPGEKTTNGQTGQGKVSERQTGRIKILEDSDGDGA